VSDPAGETSTILGHIQPRLWTPPLVTGPPGPCGCGCALTPETSYGFDAEWFADRVLEEPLDPWERWLVIHAGELLPDGRPRFRRVLVIVARQQGKSHVLRVLVLYWLFVEKQPLVFGTSTDRSYAKAAWRKAVDTAKENRWLAAELPARCTVEQTGDEEFRTVHKTKYRFGAVNRRAGRSLTIYRLILDEIREHQNWDAWSATTNAMNAVTDGQIFAVSNQGDASSVVLISLRDGALAFITTGLGDRRLGLFEWSCPPGSKPTDLAALAMANPQLGRRTDPDALMSGALSAERNGGEELVQWMTEVMCMMVDRLDPAISAERWAACGVPNGAQPVDLAPHRRRTALCVDVSLDLSHATLVAAAVVEGKVRVEVVAAWAGFGCTKALRAELPGIVAKVRPKIVGWFPNGPAASVAAELAERRGWPPRGVAIEEIRGEVTAVCMGLAEQVVAGDVEHPHDGVLTAHITSATKLPRGDAWVFARAAAEADSSTDEDGATGGPIDAAYACAGAVHLARTLPPAPPPLTAL